MFDYLDIRTIALTNLLFFLSYGFFTLIYAKNNRKFKGLHTLGIGFILGGVGFFLLGLRAFIPAFLSVVVANQLLIMCLISMYIGITRLKSIHFFEGDIFSILVGLIMLVLFIYFTYFEPSINARIVTISISCGSLSILIAISLSLSQLNRRDTASSILAGFHVAFGLFMTFRAIYTINSSELSDFMQAATIHALATILFQMLTLVTSFMTLWFASNNLNLELKQQARTDPLTGLFNRRTLDELGSMEMSRSIRYKKNFSIIMCDIDHFKALNDLHGHQFGDVVLKHAAETIKSSVRDHDVVARYGGEEFTVLLYETNIQQAAMIAEKIRIKIAEAEFSRDSIVDIKIFASFGVATYLQGQEHFHQLLDLADEALFQAKESGRNCVIVSKKGLTQFPQF